MTTPPSPDDRDTALGKARYAARNGVFTLARETGAQLITRPAYQGAHAAVRDAEPLAGMRAARDLEFGVRHAALGYIRRAREAGHSWHAIGLALGVVPCGDVDQAGQTVAEAAYTYAAGNPHTEAARRYGRSFTWTCRACDGLIDDRGLINGPADDEHGHAGSCQRLAATIARWDAEWEAGQ